MNKQDKDKILEIAQLCNNNYEECKTCRQLECDNRGKYVGAIEMAEWKEQQMIEKAVEWIDYYNRNGGCLFDDWEDVFRKEMKE